METGRVLAEMALALERRRSPDEVIAMISSYAVSLLGADDAGVLAMESRDDEFTTPSATSGLVDKAHQLQVVFDEGPCLDAIEGKATYRTGQTADDPRWPQWGPAVAELGIQSAMGVRLATRQRSYGSLNIYARTTDAFSAQDADIAEMLAAHATAAIAWADREKGLMSALETRNVIGQAQGIVMEKFDIDADVAFQFLRRISQDENVKLAAVAEAIAVQRDANARPDRAIT